MRTFYIEIAANTQQLTDIFHDVYLQHPPKRAFEKPISDQTEGHHFLTLFKTVTDAARFFKTWEKERKYHDIPPAALIAGNVSVSHMEQTIATEGYETYTPSSENNTRSPGFY